MTTAPFRRSMPPTGCSLSLLSSAKCPPGASIVTCPRPQAAAPGPASQPDAGRVVEDVGDQRLEVVLVGGHAGLEAALEEMPAAVVAAVEADRIEAVQALHAQRELRLRR